jgi:Transposase DDE domain group 1
MPAKVASTEPLPGLSPVADKPVVARFDGGRLSSDGGLLALREIEQRLGIASRVACCIADPRVLKQVCQCVCKTPRLCQTKIPQLTHWPDLRVGRPPLGIIASWMEGDAGGSTWGAGDDPGSLSSGRVGERHRPSRRTGPQDGPQIHRARPGAAALHTTSATAVMIDGFASFLRDRVSVFPELSGRRLWREIRELGFDGGYTSVTGFLRDIRPAVTAGFEVRFETPP